MRSYLTLYKVRETKAMEIMERSLGDVGFQALSGDLTEGSAYRQGAIFHRIDRLAASGKRLLVLDLTHLASVDAMGLARLQRLTGVREPAAPISSC